MKLLKETIESIEPSNIEAIKKAWKVVDNLSKPIGSLGVLEELSVKMAGIKGKLKYESFKKNIIIMCGDNGVIEEGVSSNPQSITQIVMENFTKGTTGVCILAKSEGSEITVVDVGVNGDFNNEKIINKKIAYGTKNMTKEPAMTREETIKAIEVGIEIVNSLKEKGYNMLGTGEMGVANTTTSAAVLKVLLQLDIDEAVGKGSGITDLQLENKKRVVEKAIELNKPDRKDVIDVLSKVGGFDIAALCGCFLGAASNKIPIVIDGLITSAAALCAYELKESIVDYVFPSHLSAEPGMIFAMKKMKLEPMLNLKMRLGEGSGCPMAFNLIETALYTICNMASFEDAGIDKGFYVDIR